MAEAVALSVPAAPAIGESTRLGATMVLSILVHAMAILGIGFVVEDAAPMLPTLDVILTETTSPLTQAQADFLAQATNQGGGEHDRTHRPRDDQAGLVAQAESGVAPIEMRAQSPSAQPPPQARTVASTRGAEALPAPDPTPQADDSALPRGPEKVERDLAMARLAAEIHLRSERYAKRPKRKFISANTQEYEYASYMRAWVARVERIGNLNYPDEARRQQIYGNLRLLVSINRDGTLYEVQVLESSGQPLLDQAAQRIVRLAAPFAPFSGDLNDVDRLEIIRTWRFAKGDRLSSN